jgi:hypothetical protein
MSTLEQTGRADPTRVAIRLVTAAGRKPLTGLAEVGVRWLNRRGALLVLATPFIHGCHILMDVHNITPKLVQVYFPGENPETHQQLVMTGRVETYRQDESVGGPRFLAEVVWVDEGPVGPEQARSLKRLIRLVNKGMGPLGGAT